MEWSANEETACLSEGKHNGAIYQSAVTLREKLPHPRPDLEDLMQDFRIYAMEAIVLYDPRRGANFHTFMRNHFRLRSIQAFNVAWWVKNHPKGAGIYSHSFQEDREEGTDASDSSTLVPPERDTQELEEQLKELRGALSEECLSLFDWFAERIKYTDGAEILYAFTSVQGGSMIQRRTGLEKERLKEFLAEIKEKAPKYISNVGAE